MSLYVDVLAQLQRDLEELEVRRAAILAAIASCRALVTASAPPPPQVRGAGQRAILEALRTGPLTAREIIERTGGSRTTIEPTLTRLKKRGIIERTKVHGSAGLWRLSGPSEVGS